MSKYTMVCKGCGNQFETDTARLYCTNCKYYPSTDVMPTQKYGMLTIVAMEKRQCGRQKKWYAQVQCDCGSPPKWAMWENINYGKSTSCGCKSIQNSREAIRRLINERTNSILKMANENPELTLQEIGDAHGVSREWVRTAIKRHGDSKPHSARSAKETREENDRLKAFIKANGLVYPT